jgi:hypothetical protein
MEINEILKTVLLKEQDIKNKTIVNESNYDSMDSAEHDNLSDYDRVELALEMLYGIEKNHKGLAQAVVRLEELCDSMKLEYGIEDDEMEDDGEDYEDEMEDDENEGMMTNPSLQSFTLSMKR